MGEQLSLFAAPIRATRPLRAHRRHRGLMRRVALCLRVFPELRDQPITVGITRAADGIAVLDDFVIRFDIRRRLPTFYTVGHELTHLVQAKGRIPGGEVQCDIWTIARDPLFHDEPPCYLRLPTRVRRNWTTLAPRVAALCREAIEIRPRHRTYIRWLGGRLEELARDVAPGPTVA